MLEQLSDHKIALDGRFRVTYKCVLIYLILTYLLIYLQLISPCLSEQLRLPFVLTVDFWPNKRFMF